MMLAFRMRHRIDIQQPVETVNETNGALTTTWQSILTELEAAAIVPLSGREFMAAQSVQSGVNTRITIREMSVNPNMRIVHNNTIYNIRAVLPDPTLTRYINLMCESGFNNG